MAEDSVAKKPTGLRSLLRGDIALALGVVAILVVLILPMPTWMLDISLALSLTLSVLVLMTVLFIEKPLELSSFPSILLIATMIRLALNLASTRLILEHGHQGHDAAGQVIKAFGDFIMQGNFIIGLTVFAILVIVNFVVITKGSGRIAEVAARFSLDSMPGKQMAIDADLSAGMINESEAKQRRSELEQESSFFGSMDGAAKFVRGDAIAGLLITFINIVVGMIIGIVQQGLSAGEAAANYTHLTVGDGLVSQIPALIVSIAAGLLVTKAGVAGSTDKALFGQLSKYPFAMALSSVLMITMAAMPGIPALPFLIMGGLSGFGAYTVMNRTRIAEQKVITEEETEAAKPAPAPEEPISKSLALDTIRVELGYALLPLVNNDGEAKLTEQ
ncbi:MAG: FHIPEP family type III secretion protein, partial [Pseudomonadota bacterium]